ncbi:ZP domain-containing protein-like [Branchiostoma floridae x Branchiostoma japonicum]
MPFYYHVDECTDGTNNCHSAASCTNTDGSFTCACPTGYVGDGISCTHVDECTDGSHNCHEKATCSDTVEGFNCTCEEGYNGDGVTCTALSDLVFTDVGIDYLTLSWRAPTDLTITRYRLRYRPTGGSDQDLSPPPSPGDTAATVPGLWADTEYTFTLTAFGDGDEEIGEISGAETTAEVIVNVECHQDHMTVTFPRAALPEVDVDNMHLLNDSCRATVTDTEVTLQTGLQDCGTIQDSSEEDKFTFINEAIASPVTSDNGAVRGAPFSKRFWCKFLRQYVVSQGGEILYNIPSPRVQVVGAENNLTFEMHMFKSSDFTATYNSDDYPVQVSSSDNLNFRLSVSSPLNDLKLFALRCLATPSTDPEDSPSISIIHDGAWCVGTINSRASSIQMLSFPPRQGYMYFHCTMVVCFKNDPDSRCSQGCIPPSRRRRAVSDLSQARVRRASERDSTRTVTQGPFKMENTQEQASSLPTVGIAVGTAAGIAGVLLVAVAAFQVGKSRGRNTKELAEDRYECYSGSDMFNLLETKPQGSVENVTVVQTCLTC